MTIENRVELDADKVRARYAVERQKRLRSDGIEQFLPPVGKFAKFSEDPRVKQSLQREPISETSDAICIGGGFGSLLAAVRMKKSGLETIRIIDEADDFGGTWYWNRYPGAACDIESYVYLPLLEELGVVPTEKYAHAPEILALAQNIGQTYELYELACFQTRVSEARWSDTEHLWEVTTNRGDKLKARYLVSATGPLSKPKIPNIPGIADFTGHMFHTSRWDFEYTGGDSSGNMSKLEDKKVAIIGTGSTSIQAVPHLANDAKKLYVIQRTPSVVTYRHNQPTDQSWAKSLTPGWQGDRKRNFIESIACLTDKDLVDDGWTHIAKLAGPLIPVGAAEGVVVTEEMMAEAERLDFTAMKEIHRRIDTIVSDPGVAASLKPYFRMNCKRPTFSDEYLPAFNRSNVELVDTQGAGVERFTPKGIVCCGQEIEVDCVILASGFEVGTEYRSRAGFEVYGRDGRSLSDTWKDGYKTLFGSMVRGFPNFFPVGMFQVGVASNYMHTLDEITLTVGHVVGHVERAKGSCFEVTEAGENEWQERFRSRFAGIEFLQSCTPGYYNNEGGEDLQKFSLFAGSYGGGPIEYFDMLDSWRKDANLPGIAIT